MSNWLDKLVKSWETRKWTFCVLSTYPSRSLSITTFLAPPIPHNLTSSFVSVTITTAARIQPENKTWFWVVIFFTGQSWLFLQLCLKGCVLSVISHQPLLPHHTSACRVNPYNSIQERDKVKITSWQFLPRLIVFTEESLPPLLSKRWCVGVCMENINSRLD